MSELIIENKILTIIEEILEIEAGSIMLEQTFDELLLISKFPDFDTFVKYFHGRYMLKDAAE